MPVEAPAPGILRFGAFEVDLRTGELRKHGMRLKLQEQPFKILAMLLERPGELVTREQIKERLWPADTFVDFDHSVNTAVRRLRDALNDDADTPRFIETLPRRGYRFVGQVSRPEESSESAVAVGVVVAPAPSPLARFRLALWLPALLIVIGGAALLGWRFWPRTVIDSVAVLPFANETKDPNLDYLADGIPGRVIDTLSEIPSLRVASRNSAFRFRKLPVNTSETAAALGVRALLLGTVSKQRDALHVSVELVDSHGDRHVWGEEYDIAPPQLATLDERISRAIANKLRHRLPPAGPRQTNPIAYDAFLRGDHLLNLRVNQTFGMAASFFQQAIDADPNYALAWAGMAKAYGLAAFYGGMDAEKAQRLQEVAVNRALELDPNLALAWVNKAAGLQNYHRDLAGAEQAARRAVDLGPNLPEAYQVLNAILRLRGHVDEAIAALQRAEELDPLWGGYTTARVYTYYYARKFDDALRFRQERRLLQEDRYYRQIYGLIYAASGHPKEAVAEVEVFKLDRMPPWNRCVIAQVYGMAGQAAKAREILAAALQVQQQQGRSAERACSPYDAAGAYAAIGDRKAMLDSLAAADSTLDPKLLHILVDPVFDRYRSDPAFQEIVKRATTPR